MKDRLTVRLPEGVDSLARMLARAHRDELLPLAAALRIDPGRLGFSDLVRHLSAGVRRLGSHGLTNVLFRRGEGEPWEVVLAGMAGRVRVDPDEVEEVELELVRRWATRAWAGMPPARRAEAWAALGLGGEAPESGDDAMDDATRRLGRTRFGYRLSTLLGSRTVPQRILLAGCLLAPPFGCLLQPILPLLWPVLAWHALRPDPDRLLPLVVQVARIRQAVIHRVTIGFVGSPSTGKDAAIRALFGIDSGNISPVAGSTTSVQIHAVPGATALHVVNTPGLGDVVAAVTEEARQILDHIDVFVYLVNAEGGVQARELADWKACVASGRPCLAVVNKIDVLRPRDRERYLADARAKLGAPERDFVPAAFDPLPELAPAPINLDRVHEWLRDRLVELGKDPAELPSPPTPATPAPPTSPPTPDPPGTP